MCVVCEREREREREERRTQGEHANTQNKIFYDKSSIRAMMPQVAREGESRNKCVRYRLSSFLPPFPFLVIDSFPSTSLR